MPIMYETDDGITFEGPKKAIQIKRGISFESLKKRIHDKVKLQKHESKYIALQICDDEDVETMIQSFEQQQEMSVIELCVEVDVAGASAINLTNSLLSCGNNMSHNESGSATVGTNSEEDFDDDDYLISNSYAEDSLDEDEDINEMSDTDDEAARLIEPLTVVQSGEGGSQTPFWDSASHYSNINWSYPDQEEICGLDMESNFNMGQELYVGMIKEDPSLKISLIQERINGMFNYNISYRKAWKAKQKAITIEYGDWDESYAVLPSWLKHMQNHSLGSIKAAVANEALGWQPPHAYHVYCVRHIASNFNHKFKNGKQKEMLKKLGTFHGPPSGAFGVGSSLFWVNEGVPPEGGEDPSMPVILYPGWKSCGYEYIGAICDGSWVNTSGV
ncbi:hypothetical protein HKD37_02G005320 [Glycine soja]